MNLFFKTQNVECVYRNSEFFLVFFLIVTELGHSEIVNLKSMFPMSNIAVSTFACEP